VVGDCLAREVHGELAGVAGRLWVIDAFEFAN
jgi:hypothetical protein